MIASRTMVVAMFVLSLIHRVISMMSPELELSGRPIGIY